MKPRIWRDPESTVWYGETEHGRFYTGSWTFTLECLLGELQFHFVRKAIEEAKSNGARA